MQLNGVILKLPSYILTARKHNKNITLISGLVVLFLFDSDLLFYSISIDIDIGGYKSLIVYIPYRQYYPLSLFDWYFYVSHVIYILFQDPYMSTALSLLLGFFIQFHLTNRVTQYIVVLSFHRETHSIYVLINPMQTIKRLDIVLYIDDILVI